MRLWRWSKQTKRCEILGTRNSLHYVIESGTDTAQTIKFTTTLVDFLKTCSLNWSSHNTLQRWSSCAWYRACGCQTTSRCQPFPGPGLAIRAARWNHWRKLLAVRESDAILREEMPAGLDRDIRQYFTVNTGVRSVGVTGDGLTTTLSLSRAITSIDGMTADFPAKIPGSSPKNLSPYP